MILASWLNGLKSTNARRRFGRLANRVRPTAKRRKLIDAGWFHKPIHTAEILEDRTLLFAPVALDDSYSVAEDTQLSVSASGILSNDYDNDFDPITASLVADVSHGTLSLSSDGSFTYDPDTAYNGLDTFTYVANDGSENSNTATVTITVGTNTAPDAVNDSYTVKKGYLNTDTESFDGVIVNDSDAESHPLTATLQSGPSNGTILDWTAGKKFGPNGEFKYRPDDEFYGNDTFVYQLSDGQDTDTATVTLTVVDTFDDRTDESNAGSTKVTWHGNIGTSGVSGETVTAIGTDPYGGLFYSAMSNANPVISLETKVASDTVIPDSIEISVKLGSVTEDSVHFSTTGLATGDTVRFAVQVDASTLDTGLYIYEVMVIAHYGSESNKEKYTGYHRINNLADSTLGDGWDYSGLERLAIQSDGAMHISGTGTLDWYAVDEIGLYTGEPGDAAFKTLSKNIMTNEFTLTDKFGNVSEFNSDGYLTSREDSNENTFTFAYVDTDSDGDTDDISTITDPFSRVTTFAYSSGLLTTITDFDNRVTTVTHDGNGRITKVALPDPDGAGGDPSPEVDYAYSGTTFLLTSITDPEDNVTSLEYDFAGRLKKITNPGSSTKLFSPLRVQGLVDPASGLGTSSSPAAIVETLATDYSWTDELSHTTTTARTSSGSNITVTDAAGNDTAYEVDANGLITKMTEEDPDGAGSQTSPVTTYEYDSKGNLTKVTNPDTTTRTWVYNASNMPTSFTNELAKVTSYTYDSDSNLLTITNPESEKITYTYNADGTVATFKLPDPDGAGPRTASTTSYTYDTKNRVTTITNPDSTTQAFTYSTADMVLTSTNELSDVTTYTYDNLDQLLTKTLPDPDGAGPLASPVISYAYDASGNLTTVTDAASGVTTYAYNNRDFLTSITLPDPDGAGPAASPVATYTYDNAGKQLTVKDPLNNTTTYAYNNIDQLTSITDALSKVTSFVYDDIGNLTKITDARSNDTTFEYDSVRNNTKITNALSGTIVFAYDNGRRLTSLTDERSNVTTFGYDNADRMTTITDDLSNVTTYAYDDVGLLTSVTDDLSNVTSYEYDSMLRNTKITDALSNDTTFAYDNAGKLTSITDDLSNVTTYAYDDLGQLTSITDDLSNVTSFEYDILGNNTKITDDLSNVTTFNHDNLSRLIKITDDLSNEYEFAYDAASNLTSETNELDKTTSYTYDAVGQLTKITDALSKDTSFAYDAVGNLTTVTDALLNVTTYTYDALNRNTKITDDLSNDTTYAYDAASNLTSITDARSNVTSFAYDDLNRLTTTTDDLSKTTVYAYNDIGQVTSFTDQLSNVTSFTYDAVGQLTKITDDLANETAFAYDAVGNLTTVTDDLSNVTTYTYDDLYRNTKITDDLGGERDFVYDDVGNLTSTDDELNRTTTFAYNDLYQLTSVTDPLSNVTEYAYDAAGQNTSITDPLDKVISYVYDAVGQITKVTDQLTGDTTFVYDAVGNMTSLTDPSSNATTFAYDDLGRLTSETNALTKVRSYVYDAVGNVTKITDRNGGIREFVYDDLDRLTTETWKNGTTTVETLTFTYNDAGYLLTAGDGDSSLTYTYDDLYRVLTEDNTGTSGVPDVVLTSGYDDVGNRTSLDAKIGTTDDFQNDYTYDDIYRMTRVEQTDITGGNIVTDKRIDLVYNAASQFTSLKRYEDLTATNLVAETTYTYDSAGRLTDLTHKKSTTTFADYDWTFDVNGRITKLVSDDGTTDYTYDNSGQLTGATHTYQTNESFTYDATGNRTNTGYTTGTNNRVTSDGSYDYLYDDEGNRTKKTDKTTGDYVEYEWDHRNHLVTVTFRDSLDAKTKEIEYDYDAFDRRIAKHVDSDGNGTIDSTENYVYDGSDIVLVFDGSDNLTDRYLHGPLIDQVFAAEDSSSNNVLWALTDNQGSVRDVADYNSGTDTTTVSNHIKYDGFGNITAESNSSINFLYSYTGRIYDGDAELYFYRARWYDAVIGRFIGEDPLGFGAGDVNLSRYVGNSSPNLTDPSGMDPEAETDSGSFVNTGTTEFSSFQKRGGKNNGPLGPLMSADMSAEVGEDGTTEKWKKDYDKAWDDWSRRVVKKWQKVVDEYEKDRTENIELIRDDFNSVMDEIKPSPLSPNFIIWFIVDGGVNSGIDSIEYGLDNGHGDPGLSWGLGFSKFFGLEDIEDGRSGEEIDGDPLTGWERATKFTTGVITFGGTVVGALKFIPGLGGKGFWPKTKPKTPNCFVAGTAVVMANQVTTTFASPHSNNTSIALSEWDKEMMALAGTILLVGVAGQRIGNRKKKRKRTAKEESNLVWNRFVEEDEQDRRLTRNSSVNNREEETEQNENDSPDEWFQTEDSIAELDDSMNSTIEPLIAASSDSHRQSEKTRTTTKRLPKFWLTAYLLLSGILFWNAAPETDKPVLSTTVTASTVAPESAEPKFVTKPIEQIQLGDRVVGKNPQKSSEDAVEDPNQSTWRKLTLWMPEPNGGRLDMEFLRPQKLIEENGVKVGSTIPLNIIELGVKGDAFITKIEPSPEIATGPGNVVTALYIHSSGTILDISVEGLPKPIGTTARHPFWSIDRNDFINAGDLRVGEKLMGANGKVLRVENIAKRDRLEKVYNIEVHGEHVYRVSSIGILVHNAKTPLPDDANVVRGGENKIESFTKGKGVTVDEHGKLQGVSTQSKGGATIDELTNTEFVPHNKIGTTTVGDIKKAGGKIIPDGTPKNPNHATAGGLTAEKFKELFNPPKKNPNPGKVVK